MDNREAILTNSFSYYYNYNVYKGGIINMGGLNINFLIYI